MHIFCLTSFAVLFASLFGTTYQANVNLVPVTCDEELGVVNVGRNLIACRRSGQHYKCQRCNAPLFRSCRKFLGKFGASNLGGTSISVKADALWVHPISQYANVIGQPSPSNNGKGSKAGWRCEVSNAFPLPDTSCQGCAFLPGATW